MKLKFTFLAFILLFFLLLLGASSTSANSDQMIIVNKTNNQLAFFDKGELVKTFSVGTGRTVDLTPEGKFKIVNRMQNVPYYKYNIPGGHPNNPLGPRWLGINARGTNGHVYGIHGNNNSSSIGGYVSAGCVRMLNNEVTWLYNHVKVGADVIILRSPNTFEAMAEYFGYKLKKKEVVTLTPPPPPPPKPVLVYMNNEKLSFHKKQEPYMTKNNRSMIPLRVLFEKLGAEIEWNGAERKVTATKGKNTLEITINSNKAIINGEMITVDQAPEIKNSLTFVPVRLVSEALNAEVKWDPKAHAVHIIPVPEPEPEPELPIEEEPVEEEGTLPIMISIDEETNVEGYYINEQAYGNAEEILELLGAERVAVSDNQVDFVMEDQVITINFELEIIVIDGVTSPLEEELFWIDETNLFIPLTLLMTMFDMELEWSLVE